MPNLIGTAPNQVPTNGALGNMAFQNKEAVSVDTLVTTGNVGIGTNSPGTKLEVATSTSGGKGGEVIITNSGARAAGNYSQLAFKPNSDYAGSVVGAFIRGAASNGNANNPCDLIFGTGIGGAPTERARIDSDGNLIVGGTAAGGWRLRSESPSDASLYIYNTAGNGNRISFADQSWQAEISHTGGNLNFKTGGTSSTRLTIDTSGNLLVGTSTAVTSNGTNLNLYGTSASNLSLQNATTGTGNGNGFQLIQDGVITYLYNRANGAMTFATNNTERARIDSSGNLLVGTTSTTALSSGASANPGFGVFSGQVRSQWNSDANAYWSKGPGHTNNTFHSFYDENVQVGSITTNGTNAAFNTSSDARLKHDIVDAPEASSLIDAIKVRSFKWNADNSEQRYGMVAQELIEVAPEAVSVPADEDQMMGVDYSKLVPMLVKEIQSLRARVAQLEGN